jgi:hypothetical protein
MFLYRWIPFQDRKRMMINLGFSEMRFIESYISSKIRKLIQTPLKKKNVFRFSGEGAQFIVIFTNPPSLFIDEEKYFITVISEKVHLPRFFLTSKLNLSDRLDSIMSSTMDHLTELEINDKNLNKIEIKHYPELNKKYALLGENKKSTIQFFTEEKSEKLSQIKNRFEIFANRDLFTIKLDTYLYDEISEVEKMRKSIKLAQSVYRIFSS